MNCFEFRRICIAEPRSPNAEFRRHRTGCPGCAVFAERQEGFERALAGAIRIDVPPELAARVILRQTTGRPLPRRPLAYAASVLVALAAALALMWKPDSPEIDRLVMEHILDEPEHLMSQDELPIERAARVLANVGVSLRGELGVIRFADNCPGRPGAHLVLAGRNGPVTVMIMPTRPVANRQVLAHGGFTGIVVPAGGGSLAIVGLPGEPLDEHERRVRAAISEIT